MSWANTWADIDVNSKGALTGVSSLDGITPTRVAVDPATGAILVSSAGGGITLMTATGTVNGLNAAFTFVSEPTVIVSDNATYRVNNGWTWNAGLLQATMSVPPSSDIFGMM